MEGGNYTSSVTIIIPCRNEKNYILKSIEGAFNLDYPRDKLEILVVDGMSDDGTRELISELNYPNVKVLDNINKTTPYAFNIGIKNSSSEYVMILGARSFISSNYISEAITIMEANPQIYAVGNGRTEYIYATEIGKAIATATNSKMAIGPNNIRNIDKSGYVQDVENPLFRKTIFDVIGYFDEELTRNQDDDFTFRIKKAGLKVYASDKISCRYQGRETYSNLFKQYFQYGYFKVYVNKKHKTVTTFRQLVPPIFVLFVLLGFPFFYFIGVVSLFWSILFIYVFLAFSESIRLSGSLKEFFQIQYAFYNFHFGYGFGYLRGIFHFLILNRKPSLKFQILTR